MINCVPLRSQQKFILGGLVKVVGTTANVLAGMVTCEIVLINMCGWGNVDI